MRGRASKLIISYQSDGHRHAFNLSISEYLAGATLPFLTTRQGGNGFHRLFQSPAFASRMKNFLSNTRARCVRKIPCRHPSSHTARDNTVCRRPCKWPPAARLRRCVGRFRPRHDFLTKPAARIGWQRFPFSLFYSAFPLGVGAQQTCGSFRSCGQSPACSLGA